MTPYLMLFCFVEEELCCHLRGKCASETEGIKYKLLMEITQNEEALHYWGMVAENWDKEESGSSAVVYYTIFLHLWAKKQKDCSKVKRAQKNL